MVTAPSIHEMTAEREWQGILLCEARRAETGERICSCMYH